MLSHRQLFLQFMGLPSLNPVGLEISSSRGIYLYGPDGKDYIDLVSGVSVSNLGHQHPDIVKAVQDQAEKYMHLMVYGDLIQSPQVELARTLAMNLPSSLDNGVCRQYLVDATHSNIWNDRDGCELKMVRETPIVKANALDMGFELANNAVTLLELVPGG